MIPKIICWFRNLRYWKTARAVRDLHKAFQKDDGFVLTWKCNIAMTLIDHTKLTRDEANDAADHLMRHLFGVKSK